MVAHHMVCLCDIPAYAFYQRMEGEEGGMAGRDRIFGDVIYLFRSELSVIGIA